MIDYIIEVLEFCFVLGVMERWLSKELERLEGVFGVKLNIVVFIFFEVMLGSGKFVY